MPFICLLYFQIVIDDVTGKQEFPLCHRLARVIQVENESSNNLYKSASLLYTLIRKHN